MFENAVWGVDIGSASLRVVRLVRRGRKFEITTVDRIETYRDPKEATVEELDAVLRKAISIFLVNHRVRANERLCIAIPGLAFESVLLDLPPVQSRRVPELVDYEIKTRFAALGDVVTGFTILPGTSANERRVLAGAGPAAILGGYLDALGAYGLEPDRIVLAPHAFVDALRIDGIDPRDSIAVRAGMSLTDLVANTREGPIAHTEPEGTLWMARALRERHGLGVKEADGERRALESGEGPHRFEALALEYADRLVSSVESILAKAQNQHPGWSPHRIVLAGEGARVKGVEERLRRCLGVPVTSHVQWHRIALRKHLFGKSLVGELPSFGVALGAAASALSRDCISFSLIPANARREIERSVPLLGAAVLAFAAGLGVSDLCLRAAEKANAASASIVADARARLARRRELRELAEVTVRRQASINRAWRLAAEWKGWERATAELLNLLGPEALVLECQWRRSDDGRRAIVTPVVGVPRSVIHDGRSDPYVESVVERAKVAGFPAPRLLASRSVATLSTSAPESSAPSADLYWLEFEVPLDAWEGLR